MDKGREYPWSCEHILHHIAPCGPRQRLKHTAVDIFCQKIEAVCDKLGYAKKSRKENMDHLKERIIIK